MFSYGKPVAATMCIGPQGDQDGVPAGECAVRWVIVQRVNKMCIRLQGDQDGVPAGECAVRWVINQ